MDLSKILTITGKGGLYKIISSSQSSLIAESLEDGKRFPVFATNRSSTLEDISIFTVDEDIPLKDVLWKMYETEEGKKSSIDHKADDESLKEYFEKIVPEYDRERVYPSDIKKVVKWYDILLKHDLITKPEKEEKEEKDQPTTTTQDKTKSPKKPKPIKDTAKQADSTAAQKGKVKNVKTKKI